MTMTASFDRSRDPHRRYNPLTDSWVLCSPHRASRPWQGQRESEEQRDKLPLHDPACYLCPGNLRAGGSLRNPDYATTFVFPNDFPAVKEEQQQQPEVDGRASHPLLRLQAVRGQCHVICFNPAHDLTVAEMTTEQILPIIDAWSTTYRDLAALPFVGNVQIFENKGAVMGCSNPHPHGQVWATEAVPEEPLKELRAMRKYHDENGGTCLLCDYAALELTKAAESLARGDGDAAHRAVCSNDHFLCVVPFWAVWPYETLVLPYRRHVPDLLDMTDGEKRALADIIRRIACRYDNVFDCSFPYSMGIHQRPVSAAADEQKDPRYSHFHIHFYPPLLRSATVRKFLVGFEMMGEPQRDVTAEQAAKILRDCSEVHYKKRRIPK